MCRTHPRCNRTWLSNSTPVNWYGTKYEEGREIRGLFYLYDFLADQGADNTVEGIHLLLGHLSPHQHGAQVAHDRLGHAQRPAVARHLLRQEEVDTVAREDEAADAARVRV